ncbi:MAG: hypothetical protein H5U07_09005 [Candidatus Aminicenantes bacterium]|nr:hypothetical protein [Candidatus Aminicenantes bacterium]
MNKLSYFDLLRGSTYNREAVLQANLFEGRAVIMADMVTTPILVKKVRITTEVKLAGAVTGDLNMTNNEKKSKRL